MKNVKNAVKAMKMSMAALAAALLCIPVAASAASASAPALKYSGVNRGPIIISPQLPPLVLYLGEVNLFTSSSHYTETRDLPASFKGKVASVAVTSSSGNSGDFKVEIINNGTQIRFTTKTYARTATGKAVLTTTDGLQGGYKLTSVTLY